MVIKSAARSSETLGLRWLGLDLVFVRVLFPSVVVQVLIEVVEFLGLFGHMNRRHDFE